MVRGARAADRRRDAAIGVKGECDTFYVHWE